MTDREFRESANVILLNRALEQTGWRGFFCRWYISDEPLRNDAANLLRSAGGVHVSCIPDGTRLVGDGL